MPKGDFSLFFFSFFFRLGCLFFASEFLSFFLSRGNCFVRLSIKTRRLLSATTTTHRERARGVVKERERERYRTLEKSAFRERLLSELLKEKELEIHFSLAKDKKPPSRARE